MGVSSGILNSLDEAMPYVFFAGGTFISSNLAVGNTLMYRFISVLHEGSRREALLIKESGNVTNVREDILLIRGTLLTNLAERPISMLLESS